MNDYLKLFGLNSKALIRSNAQCDCFIIKLFAVGADSKQIGVELDGALYQLSV